MKIQATAALAAALAAAPTFALADPPDRVMPILYSTCPNGARVHALADVGLSTGPFKPVVGELVDALASCGHRAASAQTRDLALLMATRVTWLVTYYSGPRAIVQYGPDLRYTCLSYDTSGHTELVRSLARSFAKEILQHGGGD